VKLVTAVLRPDAVEDVREALRPLGQFGMTVTEAQGCGRQRGHSEVYRGRVFRVDFLPKQRLEMLVAEEIADRVVEAIVQTVRTGKVGDGKIWVTPVETVVRVRTGERDTDAL
jgi:nitrogen regulatory protein P-II 1